MGDHAGALGVHGAQVAMADESAGVTKLLNSEACFWMLVAVDGKLGFVQGYYLARLAGMDTTTGATIKDILKRQGSDLEHVNPFTRKVRLAITDGASYNAKFEKSVVVDRVGWSGLHFDCTVHIVSGIQSKVFELASGHVSGMVSVALSLRHSSQMVLFRRAFRVVLSRILVFDSSELGAEAESYREMVLDVFVGREPEDAHARLALSRLTAGDWRQFGRFAYRPDAGESRAEALQRIQLCLEPHLVGHSPFVFPRHRWTGLDRALRDLGMLACVHNLMTLTYEEYISSYHRPETQQQEGIHQLMDIDRPGEPGEAPQADQAKAWAAANRAYRGHALSFCQGPSACMLLVLRTVLEPMRMYMHSELAMAGGQWQTSEIAKLMSETERHQDMKAVLAPREWPLLTAAKGTVDRKVMAAIRSARTSTSTSPSPTTCSPSTCVTCVSACGLGEGRRSTNL